MRLITLFLHVLSTGFLLSSLSSSPAFLLANATPILVPRGRHAGTTTPGRPTPNTNEPPKPQVGTLIWVKEMNIRDSNNPSICLSDSKEDEKMAAMLVTEVLSPGSLLSPGSQYKGIAFGENLKNPVLNRAFLKKFTYQSYQPLLDVLQKRMTLYDISERYGQVFDTDVEVEVEPSHTNPLADTVRNEFIKQFKELQRKLSSPPPPRAAYELQPSISDYEKLSSSSPPQPVYKLQPSVP